MGGVKGDGAPQRCPPWAHARHTLPVHSTNSNDWLLCERSIGSSLHNAECFSDRCSNNDSPWSLSPCASHSTSDSQAALSLLLHRVNLRRISNTVRIFHTVLSRSVFCTLRSHTPQSHPVLSQSVYFLSVLSLTLQSHSYCYVGLFNLSLSFLQKLLISQLLCCHTHCATSYSVLKLTHWAICDYGTVFSVICHFLLF